MGIKDRTTDRHSLTVLPAVILLVAVFVAHVVATHAQPRRSTLQQSLPQSAPDDSGIMCSKKGNVGLRPKPNQVSPMAGLPQLQPTPPQVPQDTRPDLDDLSCDEIELLAEIAAAFCAETYFTVLCGTIASGCAQSDEGLKRLGEILAPHDSLVTLQKQLKGLSKACNVPPPTATRFGDPDLERLQCDAQFNALKYAQGSMDDLKWKVRHVWSIYVDRKCNPCAASLGHINVYDPCTFHERPLVRLECECRSDPSLSYPCYNRSGKTCCKNREACVLPEDDTVSPSCAGAPPEFS